MRRLGTGCVVLLALCVAATGHGVRHAVSQGATVVTAEYDDGGPMAFCDVSVFSPADPDEAAQTGSSDRHGRFAFVPDTPGTWRVTVDDGMGHRATVEVPVEEGRAAASPEGSMPVGRLPGTVVGVSVIFGCFGLYAMWRRR